MKKQYKNTKKATSYKIRHSTTYGSVSKDVYALLIDGIEVAWGDKKSIETELKHRVKLTK